MTIKDWFEVFFCTIPGWIFWGYCIACLLLEYFVNYKEQKRKEGK